MNKARFTAAEQAYYEISGQSPGMGDREMIEKTIITETAPLDPLTQPRKYDPRDNPEVGR